MRNRPLLVLTVSALAVSLGGCTSFLGVDLFRSAARAPAAEIASPVLASSEQTEVGRAHLTAGNPGLAIEAFQKALGAGEPVAPAVNGMAVAYARLGRQDLALRFFRQAIAAAPDNPMYAANVMKLISVPAAPAQEVAMAHALADEPARQQGSPSAPAAQVAANAAPAPGALQRVSRAEVRVVTLPPQSAPLAERAAVIDREFRPLVRFSIERGAVPEVRSVVRIALPPATPADRSADNPRS